MSTVRERATMPMVTGHSLRDLPCQQHTRVLVAEDS